VGPNSSSETQAAIAPVTVLIRRALKLARARFMSGSVTMISEIIAQYGSSNPSGGRPYQRISEPHTILMM
jgi:hypothetical protein